MKKKKSTALDRVWVYGISRNLSIWHSEINFRKNAETYPHFKVPPLLQCKTYHGTHSDFYYPKTGKYSQEHFLKTLETNFKDPSYIIFLEKEYIQQGEVLIALAKEMKPTVSALRGFFNQYAVCIPMLDVTSVASKLLTDLLVERLGNHPNFSEIIEYYGSPKKYVPIQRMYADIDRLRKKKYSDDDIAKKLYPKYLWIPVNFVNEPWTYEDVLQLVRERKGSKTASAKPNVMLSKEIRYYLKLLSTIASLNEYRKSIFCQANYLIRPVFDIWAKKYGYEEGGQVLTFLTSQEILELASLKKNHHRRLAEKRQMCAVYSDGTRAAGFLYGKEVEKFEKRFRIKKSSGEVQGLVASKGMAKGRAKIILSPADFSTFKKGDILIAKMTSVDFIPIMRLAAAFVTDEGGLACHAAVVAREFGVPCIVGTKNGTQLIENGSLVEVDAQKGIVRKV